MISELPWESSGLSPGLSMAGSSLCRVLIWSQNASESRSLLSFTRDDWGSASTVLSCSLETPSELHFRCNPPCLSDLGILFWLSFLFTFPYRKAKQLIYSKIFTRFNPTMIYTYHVSVKTVSTFPPVFERSRPFQGLLLQIAAKNANPRMD